VSLAKSQIPQRKRLVMYSVFGDESSDQKCDIVFAVGGVFGDETQWDDLATKWVEITRGEEFHAAEWDVRARRDQFKALVIALANSHLIGWGDAMDMQDYARLFPNGVEQLPYYNCFGTLIEHFSQYTAMCIPPGIVTFTFDQNLEVQHHASAIYHHMLEDASWEHRQYVADEITYATRKNPKIQVADLWTREIMKFVDNSKGPIKRPMRRSLEVLRKTHRFGFDIHETSFFESMRAHMEKTHVPGRALGEYEAWREKLGIIDNTENRLRYWFHLDRLERLKNSPPVTPNHYT
jgi:hypothetical protein